MHTRRAESRWLHRGFLKSRPNAGDWSKFVGGGVLAMAYFIAIIFMTGPQYIPLIRRTFRF